MSVPPRRVLHLLLAVVFAAGLGLRVYHLGVAPRPLATADEFAWTWAGMSLIRTGVPRSWSYLNAYSQKQDIQFLGQRFGLVEPWLDHPPIFALIMGGWALSTGNHDPYAMSLAVLRVLPLLLWVVTFWLFAVVLLRVHDAPTAVVALVVFAAAPPIVLQSKLVVSENLIVPLVLLAIIALDRFVERSSIVWVFVIGVCALLLPLIKIAALSLSAFLLLASIRRRQPRLVALIVAVTAIAVAAYLAYGAHYGWVLFRSVQQAHAGRWVGFDSGLILLVSTHVVSEGIIYPLFLVAGLGMVIDAAEGKGTDLYLLALVYAACMTFFADQRSVYGWYWLPLYPSLALGVASFALRMWRAESVAYPALWAVMMLPWALDPVVELAFNDRQTTRMIYFAVMLVIAALLIFGRRRRSICRGLALSFGALQLAADIFFVVRR